MICDVLLFHTFKVYFVFWSVWQNLLILNFISRFFNGFIFE